MKLITRPLLLSADCRWNYIRISMVGAVAVFVAAVCVVLLRESMSDGLTGLVLNFALLHTFYLTGLTILACETEATMAATERIDEFVNLSREVADTETNGTAAVPPEWPTQGLIEFKDLSARYAAHLDPALNIQHLVIQPGTKNGIVGRTGSGKSTLVNCLLRMLPVPAGCISIDGVDISCVELKVLRSQLSVIPQQPMIFRGSI